ncbi:hypothetical protein AC482_06975 [miscellaneous Crenarchaeota group-15 archaeon DG-45]|uniref:Glycosyl transferase family 28 C-terminal domain-containing protein n=1 Tax=miscellaneous Crenarchaeota group-15 archaeon DG-45 TaxID=1685127 RepID=A0A0M0BLN2_9ARCH|nr:MAG: hypothetical protein AC482_06975 [miscellaneous Crenarchaeota group-15 archaeon DG-45]
MAKKGVMILAGGGGHTGYARILAEALSGRAELSFLVPDADPLSLVRLEPFGPVGTLTKPRHPTTPTWRFILRMAKALYQSSGRVPRGLDAVVSTGSNFCVPPALVAWAKGIPLVNLESRVKFIKPSRTASLLQRFAEVTALQWEEQRRILRGTVFGPLLPRRTVDPWNGGYILVAGGTYGHRALFDAVSASGLENVVLQTGNLDGREYSERHPEWKVISFTERFNELLAGADVVVSPPGGTPVEALVYGKHVVVVSYPEWARAADREETRMFAGKLNAPILTAMTPSALEAAVEEARRREVPVLRDGTGPLVEAILALSAPDKIN